MDLEIYDVYKAQFRQLPVQSVNKNTPANLSSSNPSPPPPVLPHRHAILCAI